ncbi:MAG: MFS transporter [Candidatus Dormibacteraeota bacterium]|uniref:MFS transporter n=1 Tax=Candidatus Amunia macphersoniae TaxID=3127014 RepID=A0A934NFW2_9BACT|nr:MFS transporter [Candidatus Dormibacteraeota bacterium]
MTTPGPLIAGDRPAPPARLGYRRLLAINAFWFGNGAHWQPIFVSLIPVGAKLVDPVNKDILVGKVTAAGGVFALLVPIAVGWLSDRTATRWGRRRPWMVAGSLINVIGLILLSLAGTAYFLVGFYLLLQASNNVAGAAYSGVIPDVVPEAERGRASGLLGVMNGVGTVFGLVGVIVIFAIFHDSRAGVVLGYGFIAVVLTVTLVVTCRGTHERPSVRAASAAGRSPAIQPIAGAFGLVFTVLIVATLWLLIDDHVHLLNLAILLLALLGSLAIGRHMPALRDFVTPFAQRDFFWVFATRFLVQFGIFSIVPFIGFYFQDVVGTGDNTGFASSLWLAFVIVAGIAPALVCGATSDRTGRRKMFVYGAGGIMAGAVAVLLFGLVSSLPLLYLLGVVFGVGYGTYYAVDWALACDVLPNGGADAGKDMALWHISFTLPQVLAPALLAGVLHHFNESGHAFAGIASGHNLGYRVVFGAATLWFVLGTVMVSRIRAVR